MVRLREWLSIASLTMLALSGCIAGTESDENDGSASEAIDTLNQIYGEDVWVYQYEGKQVAEIYQGPLGRFEGEKWSSPNARHNISYSVLLEPRNVLSSSLGNESSTINKLEIKDSPVLELKLQDGDDLGEFWARWVHPKANLELGILPANETFRYPIDTPGRHDIFAQLLLNPDDDEPFARFTGCFCAFLSTTWTVNGEVHPLRISEETPYDASSMADRIEVPFPYGIPVIETSSKLVDGGLDGGADLALGLYLRDGSPIDCVGNSDLGPVGENHAEHEIALSWVGFRDNTTVVWVGAQKDGCGQKDSWQFFNTQPVSYEVTILVRGI